MGVALLAEGLVAGAAQGVVNDGDPRPVVERLAEFVLHGETADHPLTLSGGHLDRRRAAVGSERAVVATADQIVGLREQGAGHVDAHPGDGEEDGEIVGPAAGGMFLGARGREFTDVALCLREEQAVGAGLGEQGGERPDGGLGDSGGDGERGGLERR